MKEIYSEFPNDTLDLVLWRNIGTVSVIDVVLTMNPHLSRSIFLDIGTKILIPESIPKSANMVYLWD